MNRKMELRIIAAMAKGNVIGNKGKLPWQIPEDLKHFKELTEGYTCIMGRKTYFSIPERYRPLSNRDNIIISRTKNLSESNVQSFTSLEEALESYKERDKLFVIGGSQIYDLAMTYATHLDLTLIDGFFEGDTYFPKITEDWVIINECSEVGVNRLTNEKIKLNYITFERLI